MDEETYEEKAVVPETPAEKITAAEFCGSLSKGDKRVELLAGFHFWLEKKGSSKQTAEEFGRLFDEYRKMPA